MLDWKTAESKERLLASVIASLLPAKLDYHKIAEMYGQQASYIAIENRFRAIRKTADQLYEEARKVAVLVCHSIHTNMSFSMEVDNLVTTANEGKPAKKASAAKKDKSTGVISGKVTKTKAKSTKSKNLSKAAKLEEHILAEESPNGHDDNSDNLENGQDHEHGGLDLGNYGISAEDLYDDEE